MTPIPAFKVLPDVGASAEISLQIEPAQTPAPATAAARGERSSHQDFMDRLQASYDEGYAAGRAEVLAKVEALQEQHRAELKRALEQAQKEFAEDLAQDLARQFEEALEATRADLENDLGRAILPFVEAGVREAAVENLGAQLRDWLNGAGCVEIQVEGPGQLVHALRRQMPEHWHINVRENEQSQEVTATVDKGTLSTRIEAFLRELSGVAS